MEGCKAKLKVQLWRSCMQAVLTQVVDGLGDCSILLKQVDEHAR